MMAESRKILGIPDLHVVATAVRVPVPVGHAVSLLAGFARAITPDEARDVLRGRARRGAPWTIRRTASIPSPLEAAGHRRGARRADPAGARTAMMRSLLFSCADNLRKGAALDAIQIAEHLFRR